MRRIDQGRGPSATVQLNTGAVALVRIEGSAEAHGWGLWRGPDRGPLWGKPLVGGAASTNYEGPTGMEGCPVEERFFGEGKWDSRPRQSLLMGAQRCVGTKYLVADHSGPTRCRDITRHGPGSFDG